tara:strand:- start:1271 stop:1771 length:501 start_codon:yes stop_codon:yes gene_type:complete
MKGRIATYTLAAVLAVGGLSSALYSAQPSKTGGRRARIERRAERTEKRSKGRFKRRQLTPEERKKMGERFKKFMEKPQAKRKALEEKVDKFSKTIESMKELYQNNADYQAKVNDLVEQYKDILEARKELGLYRIRARMGQLRRGGERKHPRYKGKGKKAKIKEVKS